MPVQARYPIVLASSSAIRKRLLEGVGLPFTIRSPEDVDEEALRHEMLGEPFAMQAQKLAEAKALSVSKSYPDSLVIGADQIAAMGNKIFSKPGSDASAIEHLKLLQGQEHIQHNGIAVYRKGQRLWSHQAIARLTMRSLSLAEIEAYVAIDHPITSCGAYFYESQGKHLFSYIEGESDVVMGLAVTPLLAWLHSQKYIWLAVA